MSGTCLFSMTPRGGGGGVLVLKHPPASESAARRADSSSFRRASTRKLTDSCSATAASRVTSASLKLTLAASEEGH
jgi:hypothetical protein